VGTDKLTTASIRVRQGVVWFVHAGLADAVWAGTLWESASTASAGAADGAAALHMHEAGGEGAGGRVKKFSGVFDGDAG
jgi:hypothetical protein